MTSEAFWDRYHEALDMDDYARADLLMGIWNGAQNALETRMEELGGNINGLSFDEYQTAVATFLPKGL